MRSIDKNIKLSREDRTYLQHIAAKRWRDTGRRFMVSFALPVVAAAILSILINLLLLHKPASDYAVSGIGDFILQLGVGFFLLIPIFAVVFAVNVAMFIMKVPPLYIDLLRNRKTRMEFHPVPYTVPGSNKFFIQTGIPNNLFIEVKLETFLFINPQQVLIFEVAPFTNTFLALKSPEDIVIPELEGVIIS